MMSFGALAFTAPWALLAFGVLPLLWWVLRATPPAPQVVVFAPLRLLQKLARTPETPQSTPWWLIALRLVMAGLIILALSRPVWNPSPQIDSERPLLVIVDDGWSATPLWSRLQNQARNRILAARSDGRDVALVFTAETEALIRFGGAGIALTRLDAHSPLPWPSDRARTVERVTTALEDPQAPDMFDTVWISDGLDAGDGDRALASLVSERGDLSLVLPPTSRLALGIARVQAEPDGFAIRLRRVSDEAPRDVSVTALSSDGQALTRVTGQFQPGEARLDLTATLPLDLRNQIARLVIDNALSAGAVHVTGDRWKRPRVGLLTLEADEEAQPLTSDIHYAREALSISSELVEGDLETLLDTDPAALVMLDAARTDAPALAEFVESGGVLVRFAGPRLAARADDLLPVRLREGGRLFGGAMAWDAPQGLSPFGNTSPFAGLVAPTEAQITRQVLAEPGPDLDSKVWARLDDGTPLVTADRRGQGWIVLFHVTAGPDWSSLPLSGLYPSMLERVLALSDGADPAPPTDGSWGLERLLASNGQLTDPRLASSPIPAAEFSAARASAETPPGIWSLGAASAALNVLHPSDQLRALARDLPGASYILDDQSSERRFAGLLLSLALILLTIDGLITLVLSGRLSLPRAVLNRSASLILVVATSFVLLPQLDAQAQSQTSPDLSAEAALDVRLAYVLTGDSQIDQLSHAAMSGLARESTRRSAVEPSAPMGVNIETDEILFFPMIYWPLTEDAPALSVEAADRVSAYMNAGGLIIFDTRDGRTAASQIAPHPGLVRVLEAVDVPALQVLPDGHVLGRTFYLLTEFPGRYPDTQIWVESNPEGSARDGASSVVIGSADWASAWAIDEQGQPLAPVEGGARQRELAIRFGVNMAMYALTGNYKADQVHVPAILERLGQE